MKSVFKELLSAGNYITVNKIIAKKIGLESAVLLSYLISKSIYFEELNQLEDGYFYNTQEDIYNNTTLSSYQQRIANKNLSTLGILEIKRQGMPSKNYFKLSLDPLKELISDVKKLNDKILKNLTTSRQKNEPQEVKKLNDIYNITNKITNNITLEVDDIYNSYPSKCPITNRLLGKSSQDKIKIRSLLKERSKAEILEAIKYYIYECKKTKTYVKNFKTFLNNIPDIKDLKDREEHLRRKDEEKADKRPFSDILITAEERSRNSDILKKSKLGNLIK